MNTEDFLDGLEAGGGTNMSRYEVVYDTPELAPWMIVDTTDGSVVDRYDTEEEALAILPQYG